MGRPNGPLGHADGGMAVLVQGSRTPWPQGNICGGYIEFLQQARHAMLGMAGGLSNQIPRFNVQMRVQSWQNDLPLGQGHNHLCHVRHHWNTRRCSRQDQGVIGRGLTPFFGLQF